MILDVEIDPEINIDAETKGMPEEVKGGLLVTMTLACKKYDCHWTDLVWKVDPSGITHVNRKKP